MVYVQDMRRRARPGRCLRELRRGMGMGKMKYPALAPKTGRLTMYPHNGTIPVNGGREIVREYDTGKSLQIILRRCNVCKSPYQYMTANPANTRQRCPACLRDQRNRWSRESARRRAKDPATRERFNAANRRWRLRHRDDPVYKRRVNESAARSRAKKRGLRA